MDCDCANVEQNARKTPRVVSQIRAIAGTNSDLATTQYNFTQEQSNQKGGQIKEFIIRLFA